MPVKRRRTADGADLGDLPAWLALGAILILVALRLVFMFQASPLPDEAYYWLWGQKPDFSYYDHPPLQAWFQAAVTALTGAGRFALRLPPLLSSGVFTAVLVGYARHVEGKVGRSQVWRGVPIIWASPFVFLFAAIAFNDHLLIALLALASVAVHRLFDRLARSGRVDLWALYGAAVLIGLAGLTKYNAVVFAIGVFLAILWFRDLRPLVRSPHLYLGGVACLAMLTPVFWWNYSNGGVSFQYNLHDRVGGGADVWETGLRIALLSLSVVLLLSPFLAVAMVRALRPAQDEPVQLRNWRRMSIAVLIAMLAFFAGLSAFTYVLPYWSIVGLVAALPAAAAGFRHVWQAAAHMVYGVVICTLFVFNYTVLPLAALFAEADHESAIMFGWPEIAARVDGLRRETGAQFTAASDYREGSILAFWTGDTDTEVISSRVSQFTLWFDEPRRAGEDALILTSDWHPMGPEIEDRFATIEKLSDLAVVRFGVVLTHYQFYMGRGYRPRPQDPTQGL